MGKHESFQTRDDRRTSKPPVHAVWRGIGFIFMILIPIMSYSGAMILIEQNNKNNWVQFPYDLLANQTHLLYRIFQDPMIHIKLIVTGTLMFVFFAIFSFITFIINSAFGASRYGPYDLPPVSRPKNIRRAR